MKFKELLTVIDSNTYLNIVSEKEHWIYEGKAIFITSDLLVNDVGDFMTILQLYAVDDADGALIVIRIEGVGVNNISVKDIISKMFHDELNG